MIEQQVGRQTWEIRQSRKTVLAAAKKKAAYHRTRVKHWLGVRAKAERAVKQKGIKIVPNLFAGATSAGYSNIVKHEIAQLDEALVQDVINANRKAEEHKGRVRSYDKYVQFLSLSDADELWLTIEDAEYFGIVADAE